MATLETVPHRMHAGRGREDHGRMLALSLISGFFFLSFLADDLSLVTPLPIVAAIVVPWIAFSLLLFRRRDTWGRERAYVDWWSVPHFIGGVVMGMLGVDLVWVTLIAATWEGIEAASNVKEAPGNRVMDVVLAVGGAWIGAMLLRP